MSIPGSRPYLMSRTLPVGHSHTNQNLREIQRTFPKRNQRLNREVREESAKNAKKPTSQWILPASRSLFFASFADFLCDLCGQKLFTASSTKLLSAKNA